MTMTTDFPGGMPFLGGAIWIDLLNSTLSFDGRSQIDFLADDMAFARWCAQAGLASADGRDAAKALRDTLRPAFDLLASGSALPAPMVERVNDLLSTAPVVERLTQDDRGYRLTTSPADVSPTAAILLAGDFARFVSDHEPQRLKHCANRTCTMVFYDRGKNARRRWCSSAVCGNRDKVANYRNRQAAREVSPGA